MNVSNHYKLKGQNFWLSPERCVFWEDEKSLIVSDLHYGKTGHFRKSGIAVPQNVYKKDLQRLVQQLQYFQPRQLVVVGDLFHSRANKELDLFCKWRNDFPDLRIQLIKGNHDILQDDWYIQAGVSIYPFTWNLKNFTFYHDLSLTHDSRLTTPDYIFSGHLHPGIRVSGLAKQTLTFPCFYFSHQYAILPAFGEFTGMALIEPKSGENVFAIVQNQIIQLQ